MCCFAEPVQHVSGTQIFATMSGAEQILVYEARVATEARNSKLLPVPVRPGAQTPIEFIDLSAHEGFFEVLSSVFPPQWVSLSGDAARSPSTLKVVRVGSFEASIVPTLDDFSRLSRRFSLSLGRSSLFPWRRKRGLLHVLKERYADHAFVVYQLAPGDSLLHPFAFKFTSRYPYLFFPTLHVHDGDAPAQASFDHTFYAQRATLLEQSEGTIAELSENAPLPWFVDRRLPLSRAQIAGLQSNGDSFAGLIA